MELHYLDSTGQTHTVNDGDQENIAGWPEGFTLISTAELLSIAASKVSPPTPQQLMDAIDEAIEQHTEQVAQAKQYKSGDRCVSYAGYPNPYQAQGLAYATWRTNCWVYVIQEQAKIIAGTRTIPASAEAILELPLMVWPI